MAALGDGTTAIVARTEEKSKPRTIIQEAGWQGIATDQGVVYQCITGLKYDLSSSYGGNTHVHDNDNGCALPWPLVGCDLIRGENTQIAAWRYADKRPRIQFEHVDFTYPYRDVFFATFFCPTGLDEVEAILHTHGTRAMAVHYDLLDNSYSRIGWETSTGSTQGDSDLITYRARITFDSAESGAVLCLVVSFEFFRSATGSTMIDGFQLLPFPWRKTAEDIPRFEIAAARGDAAPLRDTEFLPVYDTTVKEDGVVNCYDASRMASNDAYLHELLTGSAAPGLSRDATDRVIGHIHDGDAPNGSKIDHPAFAQICGWNPITDVSDVKYYNASPWVGSSGGNYHFGFERSDAFEREAADGEAPAITEDDGFTSSNARILSVFRFFAPAWDAAPVLNFYLNFWVYHEAAGNARTVHAWMEVSSDAASSWTAGNEPAGFTAPSSIPNSTSDGLVRFTTTITLPNWGSNAQSSGQEYWALVKAYQTVTPQTPNPDDRVALLSYCGWLT